MIIRAVTRLTAAAPANASSATIATGTLRCGSDAGRAAGVTSGEAAGLAGTTGRRPVRIRRARRGAATPLAGGVTDEVGCVSAFPTRTCPCLSGVVTWTSSERGSITACAWEAAGCEAATRGRDRAMTRPSLDSTGSAGSAAGVAGVSTATAGAAAGAAVTATGCGAGADAAGAAAGGAAAGAGGATEDGAGDSFTGAGGSFTGAGVVTAGRKPSGSR